MPPVLGKETTAACVRMAVSIPFPAQMKYRFSLLAFRSSPDNELTEAVAKSRERRAITEKRCSYTTNTGGASAICGSPSPIAATTSASTAARAAMGRSFRRCRLPTTCAWRASSSALGITKIRLTGGEPLLRKGLVEMVRELAQHAHRRRRSARHRPHHQRTSAGRPGAAAGRRRLVARHGFHGRRRCRTLCAHYARAQRLRAGARRSARRAARRARSGEDQLRSAARLQ